MLNRSEVYSSIPGSFIHFVPIPMKIYRVSTGFGWNLIFKPKPVKLLLIMFECIEAASTRNCAMVYILYKLHGRPRGRAWHSMFKQKEKLVCARVKPEVWHSYSNK